MRSFVDQIRKEVHPPINMTNIMADRCSSPPGYALCSLIFLFFLPAQIAPEYGLGTQFLLDPQ